MSVDVPYCFTDETHGVAVDGVVIDVGDDWFGDPTDYTPVVALLCAACLLRERA